MTLLLLFKKRAFAGVHVASDRVHSRVDYILMSTSHWIANIFINIVGGRRYRVHLSSKMSSDGKRRCQALGATPSHIVGGWCDLSTLYTCDPLDEDCLELFSCEQSTKCTRPLDSQAVTSHYRCSLVCKYTLCHAICLNKAGGWG